MRGDFEDIIDFVKTYLTEADDAPAAGGDAGGAGGAVGGGMGDVGGAGGMGGAMGGGMGGAGGDIGGGGMDGEGEQPQEDPQKQVDNVIKASKKPWVDLAGVLARAMRHQWTDTEIDEINKALAGGLTLSDFAISRINVDDFANPGQQVKKTPVDDVYSQEAVRSAVMFFDVVDNVMRRETLGTDSGEVPKNSENEY